jgi:hypothetical protein
MLISNLITSNDSTIVVRKNNSIGRIHFFIGSYHDYANFGVVPMQACSRLLGRSWEYDTDALQHGTINTYTLMYKSKKIVLLKVTKCLLKFLRMIMLYTHLVLQPKRLSWREVLAKISLNAENYVDAAPCCTMLCRHVSFSHDHNPTSSNLSPAVTNFLHEFDGGLESMRMMRTSPRWICMSHALHQVTRRHQLELRVRIRFSRPPWMESATSPSYDIETRCSLMRWNANDEIFLLVLIPPPKSSCTILCIHDKVLRH